MEGLVFTGPIFYQRLKHMVQDKLHVRHRGPVDVLTLAPPKGKRREGGFRIGEMETWGLFSHGAAAALQDRLMESSDQIEALVCNYCGDFMISDFENKSVGMCKSYECSKKVPSGTLTRMPNILKVLKHELQGMLMHPRLLTQKSTYVT